MNSIHPLLTTVVLPPFTVARARTPSARRSQPSLSLRSQSSFSSPPSVHSRSFSHKTKETPTKKPPDVTYTLNHGIIGSVEASNSNSLIDVAMEKEKKSRNLTNTEPSSFKLLVSFPSGLSPSQVYVEFGDAYDRISHSDLTLALLTAKIVNSST
ncbi:uncharacterized protein LOC131603905 [Vicia villosa]|uniref:uncharacterized protein LOC131603905 n=1 Tax=Vicia villosa TaxID=3911 RepID=UPI00273C9B3D|nr:uncharacterized protein LOC131603905 [Vicia villosa]